MITRSVHPRTPPVLYMYAGRAYRGVLVYIYNIYTNPQYDAPNVRCTKVKVT
jgi:hypothetical protein